MENNSISGDVKKIDFIDWVTSWLIDSVEICSGCNKEIHFKDQGYEHSKFDGVFCEDCAKIFESGLIPDCVDN